MGLRDPPWASYSTSQDYRDLNEAMDFSYFSEPRREGLFYPD